MSEGYERGCVTLKPSGKQAFSQLPEPSAHQQSTQVTANSSHQQLFLQMIPVGFFSNNVRVPLISSMLTQ